MRQINAAITAVAGYVPEDVLSNADLEKLVDTNDEWITSRTGIKERRILKGEGQGTSVMASAAVQQLCEKRGIAPDTIDLIICATATPDMAYVSTANIVCEEVGAGNAMSFDMAAACSGFIYALETGANFVRSGNYKKVVIIGADKNSSVINYQDRTTCILFGDGAAAVLLEPTEEPFGIVDALLKTDGKGKNLLRVKAGGSAYPLNHSNLEQGEQYFYQDGRAVYKHAVTNMSEVAKEIMERNQLSGDDITYLVPHQANLRIIEATANRVEVPMERVTVNIQKYGNTTGATIPLCLWEWEDKLKKGDNLVLCAFGGGFTWGAMYLKWAY
ncbi:beta-ketoacyl-ACP synthase III [Rapidithrix thailandica]|uniref:Beta-ketoacyl-[acyl-carrier-protein] synthase III n=1 Tax=Rapidithrix thailandica TaxID=413964 RepID=A0AAW9S5N2_9BACT